MITILGGDFKKDAQAVFKKSWGGLGKPTHLLISKGFFGKDAIPLCDIVAMNSVQNAGINAGGAVAGALLLGPIGAMAGALIGSGQIVEVVFRDGRKALMQCGREDVTILTAAVYANQGTI